ncbi:signal transduction histidine kinase [Aeromicrobium panaciterrae]|uniref:Signal transduction histidine kinase n=1 Tax=Aeromicrobium panaciterrae TaxID=363861 RepID=A0ABU1UJ51_9ACTN|nr:GAF domain-containing protein [Aeromicrobium panaciterrae]MDR7085209.1 signal transduction histidine kinase [Aeromicrobium panaciterrae]
MGAKRPSPDGPQLESEVLLRQFVEQAGEVMSAQARLRELIRVNNDLTSNLDLPTLLRRIVEIGVDLIQARYGAMGVVGDERRLEQFIHVGMADNIVAQIEHLPEGKGLLGALIDDPQPVRLASISSDARSSGFPAHHPPMDSFIGVPIRVREKVFGNLYLTDSKNGQFSADDEELAQALAATAGIAIENARLFEDSEYRARWSTALVDVSRRLMSADEGDELDALIERLRDLAQADLVSVALSPGSSDELMVERAVGLGADSLLASTFAVEGTSAAEPMRTGEPAIVGNLSLHPAHGFDEQTQLGNAMIIPFSSSETATGVLCVARTSDRPPFAPRDLDMGVSFAGHISLALDRTEIHLTRRRMELLEDRSRIARDLHDHVIQRLFATGLNLQATAAGADAGTADKIMDQIREIDGAIAQIRQSIFAIRRDAESTSASLRARILEIVDRSGDQLPNKPRVTFLGPVDLMADAALTDDVSAAVTEALANAVRHAEATHVQISVSAIAGRVTIEVIDDGVGPGKTPRLSGLANLRDRAEARGGTFEILQAAGGGTRVAWSVPV